MVHGKLSLGFQSWLNKKPRLRAGLAHSLGVLDGTDSNTPLGSPLKNYNPIITFLVPHPEYNHFLKKNEEKNSFGYFAKLNLPINQGKSESQYKGVEGIRSEFILGFAY